MSRWFKCKVSNTSESGRYINLDKVSTFYISIGAVYALYEEKEKKHAILGKCDGEYVVIKGDFTSYIEAECWLDEFMEEHFLKDVTVIKGRSLPENMFYNGSHTYVGNGFSVECSSE